jgi:serine/threonine protein kinase
MHTKGIAHRDLKLDNILLVENKLKGKDLLPFVIKIIDFGFSVTTEKMQK